MFILTIEHRGTRFLLKLMTNFMSWVPRVWKNRLLEGLDKTKLLEVGMQFMGGAIKVLV